MPKKVSKPLLKVAAPARQTSQQTSGQPKSGTAPKKNKGKAPVKANQARKPKNDDSGWSLDTNNALINERTNADMKASFEEAKGKAHKLAQLWGKIASNVNTAKATTLTGKECSRHWGYLFAQFKQQKKKADKSGEASIKWPYWPALKAFYVKDPGVMPVALIQAGHGGIRVQAAESASTGAAYANDEYAVNAPDGDAENEKEEEREEQVQENEAAAADGGPDTDARADGGHDGESDGEEGEVEEEEECGAESVSEEAESASEEGKRQRVGKDDRQGSAKRRRTAMGSLTHFLQKGQEARHRLLERLIAAQSSPQQESSAEVAAMRQEVGTLTHRLTTLENAVGAVQSQGQQVLSTLQDLLPHIQTFVQAVSPIPQEPALPLLPPFVPANVPSVV